MSVYLLKFSRGMSLIALGAVVVALWVYPWLAFAPTAIWIGSLQIGSM